MEITPKSRRAAIIQLDVLRNRWKKTHPDIQMSSQEDYDTLYAAVEEATRKMESLDEWKQRVAAFSESVTTLAETFQVI